MMLLAGLFAFLAAWPFGHRSATRLPELQPTAREPPSRLRALLSKWRSGSSVHPHDAAGDLDLYIACCQAGLVPAQAVAAVAQAAQGDRAKAWSDTAAMLHLGIPPAQAWASIATMPGCSSVASVAQASAKTGAAMEPGLRRIAANLREEADAHAVARAERAGVLIALPLTACFLPAFFLLGLLPVLITLGMAMF